MIPAGALNKIRSVTIHHNSKYIVGFSFFDKDGALLWEIGNTHWRRRETVVLADNEVIIGVVAKLYPERQSFYTDFQFQIASKQDWKLTIK